MQEEEKEDKKNQKIEDQEEIGIAYRLILIFLSLPLSFIIGRWMPEVILPIGEGFYAHGYLSIILGYIILSIILNPFKHFINFIGIIGFIIILFMLWNGDINKKRLYELYYTGVSKITQNKILGKSIDHENALRKALNEDSGIERFIAKHSTKYSRFSNLTDPHIIKSFGMFHRVSKPYWNYKNDPNQIELFRPVSETIKTRTGDCDDYAICLAACMRKCGGCVQIVHSDGHLYPMLLVGKPEEKRKMNQVIRIIFPSAKNKKIHYLEKNNELWLNMDYTANHPGGKFLAQYNLEFLELCDDSKR